VPRWTLIRRSNFFGRDIQDRGTCRLGDACAVDQDVQSSVCPRAFLDESGGDAFVVGRSDHRGSLSSRRGDCRDGLSHRISVTPVDHHAGAEVAEQLGDSTSDTTAAAGHHRTTPRQ
jgi:hypothetical protein